MIVNTKSKSIHAKIFAKRNLAVTHALTEGNVRVTMIKRVALRIHAMVLNSVILFPPLNESFACTIV